MRWRRVLAAGAVLAALVGCSTLGGRKDKPVPAPDDAVARQRAPAVDGMAREGRPPGSPGAPGVRG